MAKGAVKAAGKRKGKESDEPYKEEKQAKGKKEKDPDAPKRPMSAYFMWLNDRRGSLKKEQPDLKLGETTKVMTEEWHKMTDKSKYDLMHQKDKERYLKECKSKGIRCKAAEAEEAAKNPNPPPKRNQTAYFLFNGENRDRIKKENPDVKQAQLMKIAGNEWSNMDAKKKAKYEKMAETDKKRYETEKAAWDKKQASNKGKEAKQKETQESESNKDEDEEEEDAE